MYWTRIPVITIILTLLNVTFSSVLPDRVQQHEVQKGKSVGTPTFEDGKAVIPPYTVGITWNGTLISGGAIVAEDYVLTHRTFLNGFETSELTVIQRNDEYKVKKVVTALYEVLGNLALLEMKDKFDLEQLHISAIGIRSETIPVSKSCTSSGFKEEGLFSSPQPLVPMMSLNTTDFQTCQESWPGVITEGHICVSAVDGSLASCEPAFGGPLVCEDGLLAGIADLQNTCYDVSMPGVYTDVAYYKEVIERIITKITPTESTTETTTGTSADTTTDTSTAVTYDSTTPSAANFNGVNVAVLAFSIFITLVAKSVSNHI